MRLLKSIPTNFIVALDIETVRIEDRFEDLSEEWQSAWEYKNKQDGEIPDFETLSELWVKKASLYAEFSKVCAVSLVFLNGEEAMCKEFYGLDEKIILEGLGKYLDRIESKNSSYRLVGHAAKFFDYPFVCKRYLINNMEIPIILDTAHLKPWEQKNLCTNEIWRAGGTGAGSSLQALCTALGLPVSKVDLVGDEVGKAFYNKEYKRIATYCTYDTIAVMNVVRRIKGEPLFEFNDVIVIEEDVKETVYEVIQREGSISPENVDYFIDVAKSLNDKEVENLKKLILAALGKKESELDKDEKELFKNLK